MSHERTQSIAWASVMILVALGFLPFGVIVSFYGFGNLLNGGKSLSLGTSFMLSFTGISLFVGAFFLFYVAFRLIKQP